MVVSLITNWANIDSTVRCCTKVCQRDAAIYWPIITASAKQFMVSIKIDTARGEGKGIVNVLLALAFQFCIFVLQCCIISFHIRELYYQFANLAYEVFIVNNFSQFINCAGFRFCRVQEAYHV